jgi:murein DD-endopeptidase MepM/ murein hydrolase activator NlpD
MPTLTSTRRRTYLRRALFTLALTLPAVWLALLGSYLLDDRPLGMPVAGVSRARLVSTFGAPRDGGRRRHQGVDIFARRGTPVLAAHDGVVVHTGHFRLGGLVVHTVGRRGVLAYYAHLDRLRAGLRVGELVEEGEVLGYVGNSGNARTTPPHLHFEARPLALGLPARDPVALLARHASCSTSAHDDALAREFGHKARRR